MVEDLRKILQDAQTMAEAFDKLKGAEIIATKLHSSYTPIDARREFVILEDCDISQRQFLHPYGASIAYYIFCEHAIRSEPLFKE